MGQSISLVCVSLFATGCNFSSNSFATAKAGGASSGVASGAMAAQVIFSTNPLGATSPPPGSFSAASVPASGTVPGTGLAAVNLFNADGSILAAGKTSANWPQWLTSVVIGVSGASNTSATNSHCANFATSAEASTTTNCNLGNGAVGCGAPVNQFRVSEVDCGYGTVPATGTGGGTDGVYIQANLNRTYLGTTENLMVVMNYMASTYNSAPANPQNCFSASGFYAGLCTDFLWQMYLKHSATEVVQPFMMLVPPIYNYYSNNPSNTNGNTPTSKQYILPIAADSGLSTIQFSRVGSTLNSSAAVNGTSAYLEACDVNATRTGAGANSPLCAGIIFYSMTLFRI
jgi:hypothetical protein